ncbi:MAG: hypothetical protein Q9M22_06925 [Mariprofundaceae bacterium]|nr:hypothetical protein [Mariprofundaceae bacterium]
MKHWKQWGCVFSLALNIAINAIAMNTATASECGLSCCIAAGVDGIGSSTGLSVSLQLDSMQMKSIRQGTSKVSAQSVINNNLAVRPNGVMYVVPTKMVMTKIATNFSYRLDENNAFVLTVPYIINDMEMLRGMKTPAGIRNSKLTMDTIQGLGDMSLLYIRDVWKDADIRTRKRLSLGVGIKAPTGKHQARNATGRLVHMMMQAGTGAWDGILLGNGTIAFGEHKDGGAQWFVSPSLTYQLSTRNALGYKVGSRLNYDVSTRYRATSAFNIKLDFNGVLSQKDSTNGTIDPNTGLVAYQNPNMSLIDNVNNTGIHSLFITPGFQWVVSSGISISGEYRFPVYQKTKGIQEVTDEWFFFRIRKAF